MSDLDKISQTGAEWHMSSAVILSKSKPDVEFQYGGRLGEFNSMSSHSHLPHCRVLPPGKFNVMIPEYVSYCRVLPVCHRADTMACHPRATYHIAGCCHLVNSLSWFQSHMPHCRVQSPSWRNQCYDRATLQNVRIPSANWKLFFAIFYLFLFLMQFGLWRAASFVSSPIHLFDVE